MRSSFYNSQEYREKQSALTREHWRKGTFDFLSRREKRTCARDGCAKEFHVVPHDPKKYCSQGCAAIVNNSKRRWSEEVKTKISRSLAGRFLPGGKLNPRKGIIRVPRVEVHCRNPDCNKVFFKERWRKVQYCSNQCAMRVIGGRPTSPRASRGKAGIRKDISPTIYFYSRWEANMARLYKYLGISWQYAPAAFDIGGHTYTPDFYLPETNAYVEVKNFWWRYSRIRDNKFRKRYPHIRLEVILKEEYLRLEKQYAHLIPYWEYKNSTF